MDSIKLMSLLSFMGDVEFEAACSRFNFGVEVARCSIGVVRGVVQVVKLVYRNSESYPKFEVRMR